MPQNPKSTNPADLAFSAKLRTARRAAGLSQLDTDIAAGLASGQTGWIELDHGCTLRTAVKLARLLSINLNELLEAE